MGLILLGALGVVSSILKSIRKYIVFSILTVLIYLAAVYYLFVTLPIYSTVKGTYFCATTVCFAILLVSGIKVVSRYENIKFIFISVFTVWAMNNWIAYFVVS